MHYKLIVPLIINNIVVKQGPGIKADVLAIKFKFLMC